MSVSEKFGLSRIIARSSLPPIQLTASSPKAQLLLFNGFDTVTFKPLPFQ